MKLHPYALIIGLGLGVMTFFALRHPLFALFVMILSTLGLDIVLKKREEDSPED